MYVPFDQLPEHSRIWIYQSDRKLTGAEKQQAEQVLRDFCESWTVHKQDTRASFDIEHDQFIVLAIDEDYRLASGCSIDSSVRQLKALGQNFGLNLFDRTQVAFLIGDGIKTYPLSRLKGLFETGELGKNTVTFDNLVPSRGDLSRAWRTPVEKTWLAKYLPNSTLA
jgi:hypothetical protein